MMGACGNRARHWRIVHATVGLRAPVCIFCGSPRPKPLTDDEWSDLISFARDHYVGDFVRSAIEAKIAADAAQLAQQYTDPEHWSGRLDRFCADLESKGFRVARDGLSVWIDMPVPS
jgi:hypothetical protein